MRALFAIGAIAAIGLACGCSDTMERQTPRSSRTPVPGATGNPVLWITPHPRSPMGGAQQGARDALAALEKVDENSDQGVETLRGLLIKEAPAVRLAALEALIASTNKAAALGVLEAVTDAHPAVARGLGALRACVHSQPVGRHGAHPVTAAR